MKTLFNSILKSSLLTAGLALMSATAQADPIGDIKLALLELVGPRAAMSEISKSPMEGVYQVDLGDRVLFVSQQGEHLLIGDVFDTQRHVSLAEEMRQEKVLAVVNDIDEAEMIVFSPDNVERTITVYTDVDCPYCRKLHQDVPTLVENGVKVRYLWYPRTGVGTPSYDKAVSIWCAENQQTAMDDAKLNNKIVDAKCEPNPVESQFNTGLQIGLRGTPTIVVDDGTVIGGYLEAPKLLASLGLNTEPVAKAAQ